MTYRSDEIRSDATAEAEALRRMRAEAAARRTLDAEAARRDAAAAWARKAAHAPLPAHVGAQQAARLAMVRRSSPGWTPEPAHSGATATAAQAVWRHDGHSPSSGAAAARAAMLRTTRNSR